MNYNQLIDKIYQSWDNTNITKQRLIINKYCYTFLLIYLHQLGSDNINCFITTPFYASKQNNTCI